MQINATRGLEWRPCFDIFTCTKLVVPLDYENEAAGTTYVSFMKWSSNSTSTNSTAQDILLNPGGPGESGIVLLQDSLPQFQAAIGTQYNLVGFDPRGVNNSGPNLSCFANGERGTSRIYDNPNKPLDANDTKSYGEVYARATAFGDFCTAAHSGANDTAKYVNTVATANDMRHYTKVLAESNGQDPRMSQLWYYGVSYGTVLGMTFATLFPDRVGRIVVDGVVDGEDYYQGKWLFNLHDADEAAQYFFQSCYDAGEGGNCTFWAESPPAIQARFQAIVDDMELHPIPVTIEIPAFATVSDLRTVMASVLYQPLALFAAFASMLVDLEQRNATTLAYEVGVGFRSKDDCSSSIPASFDDVEPRRFIACIDANGRYNLSTYDAWVEHANSLVALSKYMGEAWASATAINCRKLNIKAPASQVFEGYPSANHTSNPLLFISTAIDPVTPLRAAEKMVRRFGGARLLVQDSVGHASTSSVSECTYGHTRRYFDDATLPEEGTHCGADLFPFGDRALETPLKLRTRGILGIP
jgi:pimeloyl-ACP methyl ester carboxylesterase